MKENEGLLDEETRNAIITGADVELSDHGYLTVWVYLDYGGEGQGFGGYRLYAKSLGYKATSAGVFLSRVMEIAGVTKWNRLTGKAVRVKSHGELIMAIGHIIKDDWLYPAKELSGLNDLNDLEHP